VIKDIIY